MPGLIDQNELDAALDRLQPEPTTMEQVQQARTTRECSVCREVTMDTEEAFGEPRCEQCRNNLECQGCQRQVPSEDEMRYVEGEGNYCDNCSSYCDHHQGYTTEETYTTVHDEGVCESCRDEYYYRCNFCDDYSHEENIVRYISTPGWSYDDAEYACESCAEENQLVYNNFLEVSTPCDPDYHDVANVISGINTFQVRMLIDNGPRGGISVPGYLPESVFIVRQVNMEYMVAAGVELSMACSNGHNTTLESFERGIDGYCIYCREVFSQIQEHRRQTDDQNMPEYARIHGYHTHHYSDKDFLQMAKDRKTNNQMLFGIELETSFSTDHISGIPGDKRAQRVLKELQGTFVGERDGTVSNGAELISKPLSYDYLTSKTMLKRLNKAIARMKDLGAVNGTHTGIGLHIHVSRAPFKSETKAIVDMEDDMNWFINCFKDYVEVISRRKETSYCRFPISGVQKPMNASRMFIDKKALQKGSHGYALNLQNSRTPTYEFRVFNSTQDLEQLIASVEFVRNLSYFVIEQPTIIGKTFKDIVMYKPTMYLEKYVKQLAKDYPDKMKGWDRVKLKKELEVK